MATKKKWKDLPKAVRLAILAAVAVQVALISIAHADITRRPDEQIRGSKRTWRLISLINFVGPIIYFRRGRIKADS